MRLVADDREELNSILGCIPGIVMEPLLDEALEIPVELKDLGAPRMYPASQVALAGKLTVGYLCESPTIIMTWTAQRWLVFGTLGRRGIVAGLIVRGQTAAPNPIRIVERDD